VRIQLGVRSEELGIKKLLAPEFFIFESEHK